MTLAEIKTQLDAATRKHAETQLVYNQVQHNLDQALESLREAGLTPDDINALEAQLFDMETDAMVAVEKATDLLNLIEAALGS